MAVAALTNAGSAGRPSLTAGGGLVEETDERLFATAPFHRQFSPNDRTTKLRAVYDRLRTSGSVVPGV